MWQALYEELKDQGFVVITVAEDAAGNDVARPWIEAAKPGHPALVDIQHVVSELYDMVNVPTAVWIDESGKIVRLPEPAGAEDSFRGMDRVTFSLSHDARATLARTQAAYVAAVRDWVANGERSRFLPGDDALRARMGSSDPAAATAAAEFQAGEYLHATGRDDLAEPHFAEAKRLRPDSWNYKRQAWALEDPVKAGGPEFWAAVDALGESRYYAEIELETAGR